MGKTSVKTNEDLLQIIGELEKPEVQESLTSLLRKLPELEKGLDSVGNIFDFGKAVFEDKETMNKYEQLASTYNIDLETVNAMIALVEKLPKLVALIDKLENMIDFATDILQDKQSTQYLMDEAKEYTEPLLDKGKGGLAFVQQVQARADSSPQTISLFSLVKWIKDPAVQKGLNYAQAAIDVLNEKQQK